MSTLRVVSHYATAAALQSAPTRRPARIARHSYEYSARSRIARRRRVATSIPTWDWSCARPGRCAGLELDARAARDRAHPGIPGAPLSGRARGRDRATRASARRRRAASRSMSTGRSPRTRFRAICGRSRASATSSRSPRARAASASRRPPPTWRSALAHEGAARRPAGCRHLRPEPAADDGSGRAEPDQPRPAHDDRAGRATT